MKRIFYSLLLVMVSVCISYSQQTVSGKVMDEAKEPLIGATVIVEGTTVGTVTDYDGNFTLEVPAGYDKLNVQYVGYGSQTLSIADVNAGPIVLGPDAYGLEEVVVTGVMDIVRDRRTPVAVSTITTAEIQAKSGNVEFPELMKNTPSIYVANQAGGYGDSEVFTRGFDQTNTAFLLNGQPINGMEDGKMYWSNWSGMADVANAIQVQRGLGSSKLAISSVGGTTNIIMKSTGLDEGGSVRFLVGNDSYYKTTVSYNTGMKGKWGASALFTHWQGDGWAEGTKGQGQNYFLSVGFEPNETHSLNFLITGAPQWHDQNFTKRLSSYYQGTDELNEKFNANYGYLDGEYYSLRRNYYHKPVMNLNWEWKLSEMSKLSTVLYGSFGRGGGSGDIGNRDNRFFTSDGYIDWDRVYAANQASAGDAEWVVRNSVNNHQWFGLVSNYSTALSEQLTLSVGADLRRYHGSHFRELRDLMGAPAYSQRANARFGAREVTNTFEANPWKALSDFADSEDQIAYSNDETIQYAGLFGQAEYSVGQLTAFVQAAVSSQNHVRFELFNETEANEESEKVTNTGYNVKGGASYAVSNNSTVFFNTGYYSRQPFHDNIYLNFSNTVNPLTENEKIFGVEAGYKYQSRNLTANVNLYSTSWKDRTTTRTLSIGTELPSGDTLTTEGYRNTVQNQLHMGVEFDMGYRINDMIKVKGYASIGDWAYDGNLSSQFFNEDQQLLEEDQGIDVDGVKVGGAAQTTFGLGVRVAPIEKLSVDLDYNHYSKLHSNIGAGSTSLELPSFGLLDLGLAYRFDIGSNKFLSLRANVFNILDELYISKATSSFEADADDANNWNGINKDNFVAFGKTRTWNISARFDF